MTPILKIQNFGVSVVKFNLCVKPANRAVDFLIKI